MAKAVFRPNELIVISDKMVLASPVLVHEGPGVTPDIEELNAEPEPEVYTGPTAEDLRREAEEFRFQWEIEKKSMIQAAEAEAHDIVQTADRSASREREQAAEEAKSLTARAQEEAERLVSEAKRKAEDLEAESRRTIDDERKAALEESRETGRLEGYTEGKVEVDRLIQRTQLVLERAQEKRGDILVESEQEIINLVLLMTRKVVKVITDSQRDVIISNVTQALRKVRTRGDIIIRVNLADLELTTEHTNEFIKMLEGVKSIQVAEDSSVGAGGCIIETDFGEIDARISSQLTELETKILELSPIKSTLKPRPAVPAAQ